MDDKGFDRGRVRKELMAYFNNPDDVLLVWQDAGFASASLPNSSSVEAQLGKILEAPPHVVLPFLTAARNRFETAAFPEVCTALNSLNTVNPVVSSSALHTVSSDPHTSSSASSPLSPSEPLNLPTPVVGSAAEPQKAATNSTIPDEAQTLAPPPSKGILDANQSPKAELVKPVGGPAPVEPPSNATEDSEVQRANLLLVILGLASIAWHVSRYIWYDGQGMIERLLPMLPLLGGLATAYLVLRTPVDLKDGEINKRAWQSLLRVRSLPYFSDISNFLLGLLILAWLPLQFALRPVIFEHFPDDGGKKATAHVFSTTSTGSTLELDLNEASITIKSSEQVPKVMKWVHANKSWVVFAGSSTTTPDCIAKILKVSDYGWGPAIKNWGQLTPYPGCDTNKEPANDKPKKNQSNNVTTVEATSIKSPSPTFSPTLYPWPAALSTPPADQHYPVTLLWLGDEVADRGIDGFYRKLRTYFGERLLPLIVGQQAKGILFDMEFNNERLDDKLDAPVNQTFADAINAARKAGLLMVSILDPDSGYSDELFSECSKEDPPDTACWDYMAHAELLLSKEGQPASTPTMLRLCHPSKDQRSLSLVLSDLLRAEPEVKTEKLGYRLREKCDSGAKAKHPLSWHSPQTMPYLICTTSELDDSKRAKECLNNRWIVIGDKRPQKHETEPIDTYSLYLIDQNKKIMSGGAQWHVETALATVQKIQSKEKNSD